jgi:cytochrome c oxidase cbb3-type subunit 2
MKQSDRHGLGWQGIGLVAITYVHFLIFAQFAFLRRLASLDITGWNLQAVMAAMAAGGIVFSLLTPRLKPHPSPNAQLRIGLGASSVAAFLTILPLGPLASIAVSSLIGGGLGILTVTLVTHLRDWTGPRNPLLSVGLGTAIGYLICNFPPLFTAAPQVQAITAGALCLLGICVTLWKAPSLKEDVAADSPKPAVSFLYVLACFAALVWLDSAAFYIIQNTAELKAGTWEGSTHLWANGLLHLAAALLSVWLLRKRGLSLVLGGAFLALCCACLLLLDPRRALLASLFYPVGVSLYSVALVAYPSLLAPCASVEARGRQAGWLYAIAGWAASAMGIGMGQNLGHVPVAFVASAGAVILSPLLLRLFPTRRRELALTGLLMLAAFAGSRILSTRDTTPQLIQIERGRQVYISEGCINCHSQYVRPNTADVLLWGPAESIQQIRTERPLLIGNRRQGPDLAEVGNRRSPLWLKAHFLDPHEVSGASIMPAYAFLFRDRRGDDLVAYLASLHQAGAEQHMEQERQWHPSAAAIAAANAGEGQRTFQRFCATCHSPGGRTRLQTDFKRLPTDLSVGPYQDVSPRLAPVERINRLAQIVKFGIPGTDMPGHEYLSDNEVASVSLWLSKSIGQPLPNR